MKTKAVKGLFRNIFGSFSHKCQPMTVKEPGKSSIQTRIQRQPTMRMTLMRSHRRNLDVIGVVGLSAIVG